MKLFYGYSLNFYKFGEDVALMLNHHAAFGWNIVENFALKAFHGISYTSAIDVHRIYAVDILLRP